MFRSKRADVPDGARPGEPFTTALANLDKFAYIGGFSGSGGGRGDFDPKASSNGVFANAAAFNKQVMVLFLGIGSVEGPRTKTFSEALTKAGIKDVYSESPGTALELLTWRRCLNDFAPRLFKNHRVAHAPSKIARRPLPHGRGSVGPATEPRP